MRSTFSINFPAMIALATLAEQQSIGCAAETLGISQSSMSKLLMDLKNTFNDPLYIKCNNAYSITPTGEAICNMVRKFLYPGQAIISQLLDGVQSKYNISLPYWFDMKKIFTKILEVRTLYPSVSLNLIPPNNFPLEDTPRLLKRGDVDVVVRHFPYPTPYGMHVKTLGISEFMFLKRTGSDFFNDMIEIEQLLRTPIIAYNVGPCLLTILSKLNGFDEELSIIMTLTDHFSQWIDCLVDEKTLLLVTKNTGGQLINNGNYIHISIPSLITQFPIHMVWHERSSQDPVHRLIRNCLIENSLPYSSEG